MVAATGTAASLAFTVGEELVWSFSAHPVRRFAEVEELLALFTEVL